MQADTREFLSDAQLNNIFLECMHRVNQRANDIKNRTYTPVNPSYEQTIQMQNCTTSAYQLNVNTQTAQVTNYDAVGTCLTNEGLLRAMFANRYRSSCDKTVERGDLISRHLNAHAAQSKFPAEQDQKVKPNITQSNFVQGTTVNSGRCTMAKVRLGQVIQYRDFRSRTYPMTDVKKVIIADGFTVKNNVVISMKLGEGGDNSKFCRKYRESCDYDPSGFVAIIYSTPLLPLIDTGDPEVDSMAIDPLCTTPHPEYVIPSHKSLLFDTNWGTLTGFKDLANVRKLFRHLQKVTSEFKQKKNKRKYFIPRERQRHRIRKEKRMRKSIKDEAVFDPTSLFS
jgi:hypothetical protein